MGTVRPGTSTNGAEPQTERKKPRIRVLIADDHELVRQGLRALIEQEAGHKICGEAANGRKAVEMVRELQPDIVVLDISMPGLNGLDAARQIRRASQKTEILVLTMHDSEQLAQSLLSTGVLGYLLKSDIPNDLVAAIESLTQHRPFFTSKVAKMVLGGYLRNAEDEKHGNSAGTPSPREREIVQLLAEGKSNKEVASVLGLSVKTAETHRANLMRKLDLHSITDLVHYAIRNCIIEP